MCKIQILTPVAIFNSTCFGFKSPLSYAVFAGICLALLTSQLSAQNSEERFIDLKMKTLAASKALENCGNDQQCLQKYGAIMSLTNMEYTEVLRKTKAKFGYPVLPPTQLDYALLQFPPDWSFLPLKIKVQSTWEIKHPINDYGFSEYELSYADISEGLGVIAYKPGATDFVILAESSLDKSKVTTIQGTTRNCMDAEINSNKCKVIDTKSIPKGKISIFQPFFLTIAHTDTLLPWNEILQDDRNIFISGSQVYSSSQEEGFPLAFNSEHGAGDFIFTTSMFANLLQNKRMTKTFRWLEYDYWPVTVHIEMEVGEMIFDEPAAMVVIPEKVISIKGPGCSGKYEPSDARFTIKNPGKNAIFFSAVPDVPWLTVTPKEGLVEPGKASELAIGIIPEKLPRQKNNLYPAKVTFEDKVHPGQPLERQVSLQVDSLSCWQLTLTGFEEKLWHNDYTKQLKLSPMGLRLKYSILAEFVLEKRNGKWEYKSGQYKTVNIQHKNLCDPTYWQISDEESFAFTTPGPCNGIYDAYDKTLLLIKLAPQITPGLAFTGLFKHPGYPEKSSLYMVDFPYFIDRTGKHWIPLKNDWKSYPGQFSEEVKNQNETFRLEYNYQLVRTGGYDLK